MKSIALGPFQKNTLPPRRSAQAEDRNIRRVQSIFMPNLDYKNHTKNRQIKNHATRVAKIARQG